MPQAELVAMVAKVAAAGRLMAELVFRVALAGMQV